VGGTRGQPRATGRCRRRGDAGGVVADGLLAGLSLDKVIVQFPRDGGLEWVTYAAYASSADLGNGIAFFAAVGVAPRPRQ